MYNMLSEKLKEALNDQMNNEFAAAHEYMAMGAYCESRSYDGFANFYIQQAKEERFHGMKLYNYLNDRGIHAVFKEIPLKRKSMPPFSFIRWFLDEQVEILLM